MTSLSGQNVGTSGEAARGRLERGAGSLPASPARPLQSDVPDCRLAARQHVEDSSQTGPTLSEQARREMLALPGEPFWLCDWTDVVFLHFEVGVEELRRRVPFTLDLFEGRAFVSLVAFTLADMRPRRGGRWTQWLFKPFGTHRYLNLRAYVRERELSGIYFLAEWLDAPWLNLLAGPLLYGLPFRPGRLDYRNRPVDGRVKGAVRGASGTLRYEGRVVASPSTAEPGSLDEFLVERYRAFTERGGRRGWFPVWHPPWKISPVLVDSLESSLLTRLLPGDDRMRFHSVYCSPGAGGVWMGWRRE